MHSDPVWLFDLDNTLHNASPHIFPHINRSMTAYLEQHLALSREEANRCACSTGTATAPRCSD